ncbi:hypothetical protein [Aeropyrum pernix]|uniref:hypothetical protein n=1 Tax=Aeropyrum pernix TaxID=56636 RepID=UPI00130514DC|nr:hypothetical protein [Aeropyrum pernix]
MARAGPIIIISLGGFASLVVLFSRVDREIAAWLGLGVILTMILAVLLGGHVVFRR